VYALRLSLEVVVEGGEDLLVDVLEVGAGQEGRGAAGVQLLDQEGQAAVQGPVQRGRGGGGNRGGDRRRGRGRGRGGGRARGRFWGVRGGECGRGGEASQYGGEELGAVVECRPLVWRQRRVPTQELHQHICHEKT
jgi:hypothetical protein